MSIPTTQLTHLGIFVHDPTGMSEFYTEMFGMVVWIAVSSRASTSRS